MPDQPRYAPFVPFGAPQFKADHRRRGWWFAVAQGVTGAASLGAWLYLTERYGLSGTVPVGEADRVRTLERVEVGTGLASFAFYAWGAIDAIASTPPTCRQVPAP